MTVTIKTRDIICYWVLWLSALILTVALISIGAITKYSLIAQLVKSGIEFTVFITTYWLVMGAVEWLERKLK